MIFKYDYSIKYKTYFLTILCNKIMCNILNPIQDIFPKLFHQLVGNITKNETLPAWLTLQRCYKYSKCFKVRFINYKQIILIFLFLYFITFCIKSKDSIIFKFGISLKMIFMSRIKKC